MAGKGSLTNKDGFSNALTHVSGYQISYGLHVKGLLKPFTTDSSSTGVPHYQSGLWVSGHANSSGLNPFGDNTRYEGIVHGDSLSNTDVERTVDPLTVRSLGLKMPMQVVGWGYDPWGYPSPNADDNWRVSGIFNEGEPSGAFLSTTGSSTEIGAEVPYSLWNAGPLDLRFDPNRKVWTSNASVFSAQIIKVNVANGGIATEPQFPEDVTYDVKIAAGPGDYIDITGVIPISPRPNDSTFKILPRQTDDYCMIMHTIISGKANYGAWVGELYAVEECESGGTAQAATSTGVTFVSGVTSQQLAGNDAQDGSLKNTLSNTGSFPSGLTQQYGGTNHNAYGSGDFLFANSGGILGKFNLLAGSGISIVASGFGEASGTLTLQIASGIDFVTTTGANTSITSLDGLVTPLTVAQGGTGASGQIFVDTTGSNTVSGTKTFTNPILIATGTSSSPGLSFNSSASSYGFYMKSTTSEESVGISVSGLPGCLISTTGFTSYRPIFRHHPVTAVSGRNLFHVGCNIVSGYIPSGLQEWVVDGTILADVNNSGIINSQGYTVSGIDIVDEIKRYALMVG